MKKQFELKNNENSHLQVEVSYNKGGMNYFTYKQEIRGYYLSLQPIKKREYGIEFTAFSGIKMLIAETTRKNDKKEVELYENYIENNKWIELAYKFIKRVEFANEEINKIANVEE